MLSPLDPKVNPPRGVSFTVIRVNGHYEIPGHPEIPIDTKLRFDVFKAEGRDDWMAQRKSKTLSREAERWAG